MSALTPEAAVHIRDFFLKHILLEHGVTRAVIQMVPDSHLNAQTPVGTLSDLMWHLVQLEHHALTSICDGQLAPPPARTEESGAGAVLAWDAERFPETIERLRQVSGDDLLRTIEVFGGNEPAVDCLPMYLSAVLQSRAQIAMRLGELGVFEKLTLAAAAGAGSGDLAAREDSEMSDAELEQVSGGGLSLPNLGSLLNNSGLQNSLLSMFGGTNSGGSGGSNTNNSLLPFLFMAPPSGLFGGPGSGGG